MEDKITGKTESGFEFEIDARIKDDHDFVEAADEVGTSGLGSSKLFKILLGEDQYKKLKAHCREKDVFLSSERMMQEFQDIMSVSNLKN